MRLHVSVDNWAARLFAVLALSPMAGCGGSSGGAGGGTTTGSGGAGGTSSTSSSSTTKTKAECHEPEPVLVDGNPTGYVDCAGNWQHRESIQTCPVHLPTTTACDGQKFDCTTDTDCTAKPYGHCQANWVPSAICSCSYGCTTDADCGAGFICRCGPVAGACIKADCKTDADCGGNGFCATYMVNPGCGEVAFACQSLEDECAGDGDCKDGLLCTWTGTHRVCVSAGCTIGRPFLVAGDERVAEVAARSDWCAAGATPRLDDLDAPTRGAIAAHWTRAAQMEHASVGAFARFVLQLLAVGAPPDLVHDAQRAMADETRHAEVCFALASAYAGSALGPGRLAIDRALEASEPRQVLVTTILEGCVGETVAAIEAAEMAARAEDPAVRAVLLGIAEDEARHAELAWRYVRWAISETPSLGPVAEETFAGVLRSAPPAATSLEDEGGALAAHGVPSNALRLEIRRRALVGVIGLCARTMMASLARDALPPTIRIGRATELQS